MFGDDWEPGGCYLNLDVSDADDVTELRRRQLTKTKYIVEAVQQMEGTPGEKQGVLWWLMWLYVQARPEQIWPHEQNPDMLVIAAGRGAGKNRTASQTLGKWAADWEGSRWAAVGPTRDQVKRTQFSGDSGLLKTFPPSFLINGSVEDSFNKSALEITLNNGAVIAGFSSERPGSIRGENLWGAWGDEPAEWKDAGRMPMDDDTTFSNMVLAVRSGVDQGWHPKVIMTGTPKPVKLLAGDRKKGGGLLTGFDELLTHVVRTSSRANLVHLPEVYHRLIRNLEGTRIGRQEIDAELLTDVEGAKWRQAWIRQYVLSESPQWVALCVSIDHAVSKTKDSDSTGVLVLGLDVDGWYWVLEDLTGKYTPREWTAVAKDAFRRWRADKYIIERNQGGDLVAGTMVSAGVSSADVVQFAAVDSKLKRAELAALLYEPSARFPEGRVRHADHFPELIDELTTFTGAKSESSPDRLDCLSQGCRWLANYDSHDFGPLDLEGLLRRGAWG